MARVGAHPTKAMTQEPEEPKAPPKKKSNYSRIKEELGKEPEDLKAMIPVTDWGMVNGILQLKILDLLRENLEALKELKKK